MGHSNASAYTSDNLHTVYSQATKKSNSTSKLPDVMGPLIIFENGFIASVVDAATKLANFTAIAGTNPNIGLKALADFSAAIVKTFNQGLVSHLFGGPELALLGSALFTGSHPGTAERLNVIVPESALPAALFSITLPKPGAGITLADLQAGKYKADQILVEQKLASPLAGFRQTAMLVL